MIFDLFCLSLNGAFVCVCVYGWIYRKMRFIQEYCSSIRSIVYLAKGGINVNAKLPSKRITSNELLRFIIWYKIDYIFP